jgi:hypothetical protein
MAMTRGEAIRQLERYSSTRSQMKCQLHLVVVHGQTDYVIDFYLLQLDKLRYVVFHYHDQTDYSIIMAVTLHIVQLSWPYRVMSFYVTTAELITLRIIPLPRPD